VFEPPLRVFQLRPFQGSNRRELVLFWSYFGTLGALT
jgi:hypothetical protein